MAMMGGARCPPVTRAIRDGFMSAGQCAELAFILKSSAMRGYRPNVLSATIADIALTEPSLLAPLVRTSSHP